MTRNKIIKLPYAFIRLKYFNYNPIVCTIGSEGYTKLYFSRRWLYILSERLNTLFYWLDGGPEKKQILIYAVW